MSDEQFINIKCSKCKAQMISTEIYCTNCEYPEQGTVDEQEAYEKKIYLRKHSLEKAKKKIKEGRIGLYVLAGLFLIIGIVRLIMADDVVSGVAELVFYLVFSILYAWLAHWSNEKPVLAISIGLGAYIALQIVSLIIDPASIFQGVIMKVIIISALVKAISSAKEGMGIIESLPPSMRNE